MFVSDGNVVINIEYRVENKYLVSDLDIANLSLRLKSVMQSDAHQKGESYEIRSLYFDDIFDSCMDENDAGIDCRKKYRIRIYGTNDSPIHLEIKEKTSGLTKKSVCDLTREEFNMLISGGADMAFGNRAPLNQLLLRMRCTRMQPKAIVAYERTAFVHPTANVRITFDRNIAVSKHHTSLFAEHIDGTIPILPIGMHVLEVKYDEFLPDVIARQLEIGKLRKTAFSKYYLGRLAVNGDFPISV